MSSPRPGLLLMITLQILYKLGGERGKSIGSDVRSLPRARVLLSLTPFLQNAEVRITASQKLAASRQRVYPVAAALM